MIDGVVRLRHVLLHPIVVIGAYGPRKFCEIVLKAVSRRHYQFVQIVNSTPKAVL